VNKSGKSDSGKGGGLSCFILSFFRK